jgi:hypothetical protein
LGWEIDGEPYTHDGDTKWNGGAQECWAGAPITGKNFFAIWPEGFQEEKY